MASETVKQAENGTTDVRGRDDMHRKIFLDNLISIIESRSLISIYFVVTFCEITMFVSVSIDRFSVGNCKTPSHAL